MFLIWQARKMRAEHARAVSVLRQDIIRINAEKADMAAERVRLIRHIDKQDRAAADARQAFARMLDELKVTNEVLHEENAGLRAQQADR